MRKVRDLSYHELERLIASIQAFLYIDQDGNSQQIWNPDKQWSLGDACDHVAYVLSQHDLVPESRRLRTREGHQYVLGDIDGPMFRKQRQLLLRFVSLSKEGKALATNNAEQELLDGLVNMMDAIADQAHDKHGIDCLLERDSLCDCQKPGYFCSGIPGILAHVKNGQLRAESLVERCNLCLRYPTDEAARDKLVELGIA